jgi:phage-related protein
MNKIIFKDIESSEIKGLLICELPPITKPKMRVQETEINGVDGSLIEELGYETYDKTLKIALRGNYDIDEVIKYFSGSGNVTFSNEDDKYYKATIINQIDYERLLRFKEANVVFRVQPFKYALNETITTLTSSGSSVFNNGLELSKPIIKIKGTGTITLSINNLQVFSYAFPTDENEVVIDSEKQDAYLGSVLKNRNMIGDFPILESGSNLITWEGAIEKIEINPKSRWL